MSTAELQKVEVLPGMLQAREAAKPVDAALTIQEIIARKKLVSQCVAELMKEDEHFGTIPGAKKPSLWKPGADLLCSLFQLEADYITEEAIRRPDFIYYRLKCVLTSASTGIRRGAGLGSCNSHEEKYMRAAAKKCPDCGKETILRSKPRNKQEEANPDALGWFCWGKKGGCGKNFTAADPGIVNQDTGIKDPSDLDNTILKMAAKRARIDAVLTVTGASDFFTQDVEDLVRSEAEYIPPPKAAPPAVDQQARTSANDVSEASGDTTSRAPVASGRAAGATGNPVADKPKKVTANQIPHDGKQASHAQVTLLHVLRSKLGIKECNSADACMEEYEEWSKSAGKAVKKVRYCDYHQCLQAFKDKDRKPILSSKDLCPAQASHFIAYYEAKLAKQEQATREIRGAHGDEPAPDMTELAAQMASKGIDEQELCGYVGCDSITQMDKHQAIDAMSLIVAWDTELWAQARDKAMGKYGMRDQ